MARKHNKKPAIVKQWDEYFQNDDLENWQRLMKDLGLEGEFRSKTQCRNVSQTAMLRGHTCHSGNFCHNGIDG